ncbi:MAG: TMEM165/GDT1 family protein, partial [Cyanobacteria bacterium P01_H01_bin.130]
AESQSPWVVFTGAAIALIATSLVGVLLGRLLAGRLSEKVLEKVVGGIFLVVSASLLWDIFYGA